MKRRWLLAIAIATACGENAGGTGSDTDDASAGTSAGPGGGTVGTASTDVASTGSEPSSTSSVEPTTAPGEVTTEAPIPDECEASSECDGGQVCAAAFDGARDPFSCMGECIANGDDTHWCADSAACCVADATCNTVGLCVGGEDESTDTGTVSITESADDTASSSSSSSGSGSESGSSSSSTTA